ncbi:hypothetical protein OBBRIDRAFT_806535 [Obba rivulosa]|uniref:Uncharacterized protein n=1 Tax=Obba rivulosa TaxID=1052685 RepID=A0A8E2ALM3_9APHY|nr:hypothetical protein OBBRIDRAFT_806535 [Obba rivulosa]
MSSNSGDQEAIKRAKNTPMGQISAAGLEDCLNGRSIIVTDPEHEYVGLEGRIPNRSGFSSQRDGRYLYKAVIFLDQGQTDVIRLYTDQFKVTNTTVQKATAVQLGGMAYARYRQISGEQFSVVKTCFIFIMRTQEAVADIDGTQTNCVADPVLQFAHALFVATANEYRFFGRSRSGSVSIASGRLQLSKRQDGRFEAGAAKELIASAARGGRDKRESDEENAESNKFQALHTCDHSETKLETRIWGYYSAKCGKLETFRSEKDSGMPSMSSVVLGWQTEMSQCWGYGREKVSRLYQLTVSERNTTESSALRNDRETSINRSNKQPFHVKIAVINDPGQMLARRDGFAPFGMALPHDAVAESEEDGLPVEQDALQDATAGFPARGGPAVAGEPGLESLERTPFIEDFLDDASSLDGDPRMDDIPLVLVHDL